MHQPCLAVKLLVTVAHSEALHVACSCLLHVCAARIKQATCRSFATTRSAELGNQVLCVNGVSVIFQADQCKPQHIANILWAFGTLGYKPSAHLLDTLQKQATLKLSGFNPQNLANLIWAFARCAH